MSQQPPSQSKSPLSELGANSLDEYFSKDPFDMQEQDVVVICTELRRKRAQHIQEEVQGKAPKAKKDAPKQKVSLKDLGL